MSVIAALPAPALSPTRSAPLGEIVRRFTPNWFTVTMGTGILALALKQAPFATPALDRVAEALWIGNTGLFGLFSLFYAARWLMFPREAQRIFGHSVMSMFFGAIPMGLATIVNGLVAFGIPHWGDRAAALATALWWVDAAMAVVCGVAVPFLMFTRQDHSMEKMTAVWLLPIVAAEVAAASAGTLIPHVADPEAALRFLVLGYALWAFSVPLALSILVILVLRLVLHKLPHKDMAASGWLALGPIGTGALGLLLLGADAPRVCDAAGLPGIGAVAAGIGLVGGTILWGYGAWWLALAVATTIRYLRDGMPFNLGWWGFTFPIGVYAVATLALARGTHVAFLGTVGAGLVVCLALLWVTIAARTLHGAWNHALFVSPCLAKGAIPKDLEADFG
ncbi:C4-dicarboxylate ABC transporter [Aliidongia dinghuensis]|uniref:C4-dicarboxylate ABC transporter n=1 Tax=Aliidongia dinghuensis TaxID=1867774 RepID=A0A8J2YVV3_9PROT|nr:TDT family transporter [Aliidongia dinghuensis]GGF22331.1 C4-dicarboxylate ABC transporter [Aliidongia dinghuensis]